MNTAIIIFALVPQHILLSITVYCTLTMPNFQVY